jgi:predicted RNase H-like HicB family nuclease
MHCAPFIKSWWHRLPTCAILKLSVKSIAFNVGAKDFLMKHFKIIVEKHPDGYVAYPLGLKGVVVGQGETYEAVLADIKSAISFHLETFGPEVLEVDPPILEAFVAETRIEV